VTTTKQDSSLHSYARIVERIIFPVLLPPHLNNSRTPLAHRIDCEEACTCLLSLRWRRSGYVTWLQRCSQQVGGALGLDVKCIDKYCAANKDSEVIGVEFEIVTKPGRLRQSPLAATNASLSTPVAMVTRAILPCAAASSEEQNILRRYLLLAQRHN
jgi:hypothetical protein